jgi:hypothetical protein
MERFMGCMENTFMVLYKVGVVISQYFIHNTLLLKQEVTVNEPN